MSESGVLRHAIKTLKTARQSDDWDAIDGVLDLLADLERQATSGIHRNPSLVVVSNPRRGDEFLVKHQRTIGGDVHLVRYTHQQDGEPYEHPFGGDVEMWGVTRGKQRDVLLTSRDGKPLWKDFA